jgi:eukaryotic-like serine/threonine-protein kinase
MIGTKLGPYEITAKLGEGGMGEVWRAKDFHLGREVALKVLPAAFTADPERSARFEREAKALAALNHPYIAQIYGFEVQGDTRALVMELVEGPTLAERLESGGLPLDESLSIARQIAEALEEAHEKGIIHRDLKPQNIKASIEGKVKVLDFGLAKAMDPAGAASGSPSASQLAASPTLTLGATVQGMILGTAAYMSPEQAKGFAVDKRADIWAFGVVVWEMLTGRRLFDGDSVPETLAGVLRNEIDLDALPDGVPPAIRRLLRRCLERRPQDRLRDIGDARIVLAEVAAGRTGEAVAAPGGAPAPAARQPWLPWSIAALAAAVAMASTVALVSRGAPSAAPAEVFRFEVARPATGAGAADFFADYFTLSPDGRHLAIVADGQLWVRSFDALATRPLPGTAGATYPFWSPDGTWIGFFAEEELRRISREGGMAQKVCDAPGARGGAWGSADTIVFSDKFGTAGLSRVAARGGAPLRLPPVGAAGASAGDHRYPQFLPDGRRVLFTLLAADPEVAGSYVADLDGSPPVRVLDGTDQAIYAPPAAGGELGHLLFRRQSVLMALPFDGARLRAVGDAVPLVEEVGPGVNTGGGAFSVSANGLLAHAETTRGHQELVWIDRSGRPAGVVAAALVSVRGFSLAPDQRTLAYSEQDERRRTADIWLRKLDDEASSRFTFDPDPGWQYPVWSPDAREIVYGTVDFSGLGRYELRRQRVDRVGGETTLLSAGAAIYPWDWSRDGRYLAISDFAENLALLELGGEGAAVPFASGLGQQTQAAFSPDSAGSPTLRPSRARTSSSSSRSRRPAPSGRSRPPAAACRAGAAMAASSTTAATMARSWRSPCARARRLRGRRAAAALSRRPVGRKPRRPHLSAVRGWRALPRPAPRRRRRAADHRSRGLGESAAVIALRVSDAFRPLSPARSAEEPRSSSPALARSPAAAPTSARAARLVSSSQRRRSARSTPLS